VVILAPKISLSKRRHVWLAILAKKFWLGNFGWAILAWIIQAG
jgi:hypothetical protein